MKANGTGTALSNSDEWGTPIDLFDAIDRKYRFGLDLAASSINAKCSGFWTKEDDALKHDWVEASTKYGPLWCNPPYSKPNLSLFTEKARASAEKGAVIVLLVPASTSEDWFHSNVLAGMDTVATERILHGPLLGWGLRMSGRCRLWLHFLKGRKSFEWAGPEETTVARGGSVIVAYNGWK